MEEARRATIINFYTAFARRDAEGMAACYAPADQFVSFEDPAFGLLATRERAVGMWQMLTERASADFELMFSPDSVVIDGNKGKAHWEAKYQFSKTKRPVHNVIDAEFEFEENSALIKKHTDHFSMWAWTRQALGLSGVLLGWTPMVQGKVRGEANAGLDKYLANKAKKQSSE